MTETTPTPSGQPGLAEDERQTLRFGIAAVATALTLIAYYAIDRSQAAVFSPGPDPATVMASVKVEYFWRVTVCAYASPMVFAAWFALSRGREERLWRWVSRAALPIPLVAAILALVFP